MTTAVELFPKAVAEFEKRVTQVGDDQWSSSTPCTEWDVRALVNHVLNENKWVPPMLAGKTVEEVGDAYDGDLLGDNPQAAWKEAAQDAVQAAREEGAGERTVHLSFGDFPGEFYLGQMITDHVIHAWDLARGIGADDKLDEELVAFAHSVLAPQVDAWREAGALADEVEAPPGADKQTQLLAMAGRRT